MVHDGGGGLGREVGAMAGPRVICVAMGDERAIHGAPRVDVEIAKWAVNAAVGEG